MSTSKFSKWLGQFFVTCSF